MSVLFFKNDSISKKEIDFLDSKGVKAARLEESSFGSFEDFLYLKNFKSYIFENQGDLFLFFDIYPKPKKKITEFLFAIELICRIKPSSLSIIIPYLPYSRYDRSDPNEKDDISMLPLDFFVKIFKLYNIKNIFVLDIHSSFLSNALKTDFLKEQSKPKLHNIPQMFIFEEVLSKLIDFENKDDIFVSVDKGSLSRVDLFAKKFNFPVLCLDKHRVSGSVSFCLKTGLCDLKKVTNKRCFIFDDILDTGFTLIESARFLKKAGASRVVAFISHGIFSNDAFIYNISSNDIDFIYCSNSIRISKKLKKLLEATKK